MTATAPSPALPLPLAAPADADAPAPLRLSLRPAGPPTGPLDGAWWPRSSDLTREVLLLERELDRSWGRLTRLTVNPLHWSEVPRRVRASGHQVHVGWFLGEQDEHTACAFSYATGRLDLLVVPPETEPAAAARLMARAADPACALGAAALLDAERSAPGR